MKEEEKSHAQIVAEFLTNLKPHSSYEPVDDLPIPAQNGLLVKHVPRSQIETLDSGLIVSTGNNTQNTCEGIIMMVGPNCSPAPRVGLKIQFSTNVYNQAPRYIQRGKEYLGMDEYSILFYIPDESTIIDMGVKDPRQLGREKRLERQKKTTENVYNADQKEKDKKFDKTAGKIRPIS